MDIATFAAGCFWGVEEAFRQVQGVTATAVGYAGGTVDDPSYEQVCGGDTGHAEVVRVEYDPAEVEYDRLLEIFWSVHDPTQNDRQGPDIGSQYRSAIFYHSPEQEAAARASKTSLEDSGRCRGPIVTEIAPAGPFHRAEEYHQQYLLKNGRAACPSSMRRP
ncbi:MAG: peptide-methionine (S)-S-oxide reductase MsrA [Planctomycetes bacterium]|nr:peptide-methionine (S)-S-oxide reductase MsrA [Planctomycetota bacterium]